MSADKGIAGAPVADPVDSAPATESVAPVQAAPEPQQIELPVMAQPAPAAQAVPVAPEAPAPPKAKPVTKAQPKKADTGRIDALEERLEAEVAAMAEARAELQERARQERDRARLAYLRDVGAVTSLRDDHLLALAPDFDPTTADGRVELDRWREQNATLFAGREMTGVQVAEQVISNVPSSQHGTFGPRLAQKIAREVFGGN